MGRFLSVDPASSSADPMSPQTWNRYTYASNNPIILVDPDGESATLIGALAGGVSGGAAALLRGGSFREVIAGAAGGAVTGAMLGSVVDSGGLTLVAAGALAAAEGGMVQRMVSGQSNSASAVAADAAGGAAGVMIGASVGAVAQGQPSQVATESATGTEVTGFTKEGINQAINRGIKPAQILDATKNPLKMVTKVDAQGRTSTQNIGRSATVVTNPKGKVVTMWQTSSKTVEKLEQDP